MIFINKNFRTTQRSNAAATKRSAAVTKSLRELAILFGKKRPSENDKAREQAGNVGATEISKLPAHNITQRTANQDAIRKLSEQCRRNVARADKLIWELSRGGVL